MRVSNKFFKCIKHVGTVLTIVLFLKQYVLKMFLRYLVTTK